MKFSTDENQQKNLFDLSVAIVVLTTVVLTLSQNQQSKPATSQPTQNEPCSKI